MGAVQKDCRSWIKAPAGQCSALSRGQIIPCPGPGTGEEAAAPPASAWGTPAGDLSGAEDTPVPSLARFQPNQTPWTGVCRRAMPGATKSPRLLPWQGGRCPGASTGRQRLPGPPSSHTNKGVLWIALFQATITDPQRLQAAGCLLTLGSRSGAALGAKNSFALAAEDKLGKHLCSSTGYQQLSLRPGSPGG